MLIRRATLFCWWLAEEKLVSIQTALNLLPHKFPPESDSKAQRWFSFVFLLQWGWKQRLKAFCASESLSLPEWAESRRAQSESELKKWLEALAASFWLKTREHLFREVGWSLPVVLPAACRVTLSLDQSDCSWGASMLTDWCFEFKQCWFCWI